MNIGERIKNKRIECDLSQEELAKMVNTTKQTIYKYETGIITNIPSDRIEALAKALNVTPAYLMGWDKREEATQTKSETQESDFELSDTEKQIIYAYRNHPELQEGICKMLDIDNSDKSSNDADVFDNARVVNINMPSISANKN